MAMRRPGVAAVGEIGQGAGRNRHRLTGLAPGSGTAIELFSSGSSSGRTPTVPSGRERQGAESSQGLHELVLPGPALGKMQGEAAGPAGDASSQGEEASPEGLGGKDLLAQTGARRPAGRVMGQDLHRQPGGVGGEASRGEMIEAHAVLQVADGVLDLGVAAVVGLQFQSFALPVGDASVIAVVDQEGQLGVGRGLRVWPR